MISSCFLLPFDKASVLVFIFKQMEAKENRIRIIILGELSSIIISIPCCALRKMHTHNEFRELKFGHSFRQMGFKF